MFLNIFLSFSAMIFLAALGWIIFAAFTKRGRNFTFGGDILMTYKGGESRLKKQVHTFRVHAIDSGNTRKIGLEVNGSRFGEHEMIPFVMTVEETQKLITAMERAIKYQRNN